MRYSVTIEDKDGADEIFIDCVLEYKMLDGGVFYAAGTDFEQWHVLKKGYMVTVVEKTE